jgi:hypothetical protein
MRTNAKDEDRRGLKVSSLRWANIHKPLSNVKHKLYSESDLRFSPSGGKWKSRQVKGLNGQSCRISFSRGICFGDRRQGRNECVAG